MEERDELDYEYMNHKGFCRTAGHSYNWSVDYTTALAQKLGDFFKQVICAYWWSCMGFIK